jgi:hypothetical protein
MPYVPEGATGIEIQGIKDASVITLIKHMALQPSWTLAAFFSFLIYTQSVGPLRRGISPS